jgi:hypothetical protein
MTACGSSDDPSSIDSGVGVIGDESNDGQGIVNDDTAGDEIAESVCSPVRESVIYELVEPAQGNSIVSGWYVPSGAPGIYGWNGSEYCDFTASEGVQKISALIPFQQSVPTIDGVTDLFNEWGTAALATWSVEKADTLLIRNLQMATIDAYQDKSRSADWGAMHDGEDLYIFVNVRNENSSTGSQQIYLDSDNPIDDDSVTIYIDADNSKGSQYDGVNDFQSTLAYLDTARVPDFGESSASGLDITFRTDSDDDPAVREIVYEIKINLASAGISVGVPFGFDIQLNEDDNGGPRDALFAWHEASGSNQAVTNPAVFATVVLTGCPEPDNCGFEQSLSGN